MEMATKTDVRADRRRRISSREGDRMALITGRLRNLPPSPPPSPSSPPFFHHYAHQRGHSHTGINPSFFAKDTHKNPDSGPLSQNHDVSKPKDEKAPPLLKHISINEVHNNAAIEYHFNPKKLDPIGEGSTELILSPSSVTMVQKACIDNEPLPKTKPSKPRLITSKRLNASILASQTTRVFCSLIIASLAILSQVDIPLTIIRNIVRSETVMASKPLYILLLTNATIVVARMLAEKQKDRGEAEEECEKMKEDAQNWDSAVKVLERGLVFYQAFRAFFIDFSVYAVVVICGLSVLYVFGLI
ncbi:uncharacterized protein LOC111787802 [Cucurbita pepo subsp. pepo]|uniref:uncharacterized protein LOC111787802 n=1 Tax=Cucurbita pepo subsp. pepo TaxID=3664 RepID=UPI000C9DA3A1|nr:uncharacterized protein LOC111787802 [Cucurbita pepo subsp. pepo]